MSLAIEAIDMQYVVTLEDKRSVIISVKDLGINLNLIEITVGELIERLEDKANEMLQQSENNCGTCN